MGSGGATNTAIADRLVLQRAVLRVGPSRIANPIAGRTISVLIALETWRGGWQKARVQPKICSAAPLRRGTDRARVKTHLRSINAHFEDPPYVIIGNTLKPTLCRRAGVSKPTQQASKQGLEFTFRQVR